MKLDVSMGSFPYKLHLFDMKDKQSDYNKHNLKEGGIIIA
ncbi:hypothetical protein GCM10025860_00850 [Methanobacterium ferruginis]|jgi:hypothetical protein|nr:hypothetical protein GCM10025860_00850 [Methanobacterium ferruginis]